MSSFEDDDMGCGDTYEVGQGDTAVAVESPAAQQPENETVYRSTAVHPLPAKKDSCPYCGKTSHGVHDYSRCTKCDECASQRCSEKKYTHLIQQCNGCGHEWKIRPADLDTAGVFLPEKKEESKVKEPAKGTATFRFPGTPERKRRGFFVRAFVFLFKFSLIFGTLSAGLVLFVLFVLRRLLPSYCGH